MNITRRDLLTIAGGSLLGSLFTPIPWKLLDDSAIWTQNWSLIPKLPRGPITFTRTACALCPGGCAVNARRVSGIPVSLSGIAGHAVSHGALCPVGITGHHLATHPLRLHQSFKFDGIGTEGTLTPCSVDAMLKELAKELQAAAAQGTVAVLDHLPGRAVSRVYREFLKEFPQARYIIAPGSEDSCLAALRGLSNTNDKQFGYDFENARVVLSFGAPLLDGWGTPGRMLNVFGARPQTGLKLIQVESVQSRTALQADTWLPVAPGTEAALALALGHVILRDGLTPASVAKNTKDLAVYKALVASFSPDAVAERCGIPAATIVRTAHHIAVPASIVLSGSNPASGPLSRTAETAIAALNILVGNIGNPGGIQQIAAVPEASPASVPATDLADVPDNSIRVLFVDGAEYATRYPASLISKKLAKSGSTVVAFSPYLSSRSALADYLVPSPAAYESIVEITTPHGASRATLALSTPLHARPAFALDPVTFMARLAEAAGLPAIASASTEQQIRQRAGAIWLSKRGSVTSAANSLTAAKDFTSEEAFWKALTEGGYWTDEESRTKQAATFSLLGSIPADAFRAAATSSSSDGAALKLIPFGWSCTTGSAQVAPVMSKLFQESHLRNLGGQVHINPKTLAANELTDAGQVRVTTAVGTITARAVADPTVMPGIIYASVGPAPNNAAPKDKPEADGILEICAVEADGSWRITNATIARA
jgi:menaquinone reductase, molybdopterin-binding-like subunit